MRHFTILSFACLLGSPLMAQDAAEIQAELAVGDEVLETLVGNGVTLSLSSGNQIEGLLQSFDPVVIVLVANGDPFEVARSLVLEAVFNPDAIAPSTPTTDRSTSADAPLHQAAGKAGFGLGLSGLAGRAVLDFRYEMLIVGADLPFLDLLSLVDFLSSSAGGDETIPLSVYGGISIPIAGTLARFEILGVAALGFLVSTTFDPTTSAATTTVDASFAIGTALGLTFETEVGLVWGFRIPVLGISFFNESVSSENNFFSRMAAYSASSFGRSFLPTIFAGYRF